MGTVKDENGGTARMPSEAEILDDHIEDMHLNPTIDNDRDDGKRTIAIGLLILCVLIFIFLGVHFSERSSFLYWQNS